MYEYTFNQETDKILLMTKAEFEVYDNTLPYKKSMTADLREIRYCKLDKRKDCIHGTIRVPEGIETELLQFGYYRKEHLLLLVEDEKKLKQKMDRVQKNTDENKAVGTIFVALLEQILESDFHRLLEMEEILSGLEEHLIKKTPQHFNETLMRYRKRLSSYHAYYQQMMDIADTMQDGIGEQLIEEESAAWDHYGHRVERLHNYVEMLKEYLIQIREMYQSRIEEQQNRVMGLLTIITTIFFPLTLIAGWYGMNFMNMPELQWQYGYPVVIGVSILIIIAEIIYFKNKKMF